MSACLESVDRVRRPVLGATGPSRRRRYGPVLLVARSPATILREFSFYQDLSLRGDLADALRPEGRPLHFTTHGLTPAPFHLADATRYHAYFKRAEPLIVFGRGDSAVPNRARGDGLTFVDGLWQRAPFASSGVFVQAVRAVADTWVSQGC